MIEERSFRSDQRRVALAMTAGAITTVFALTAGALLDRKLGPLAFAEHVRFAITVDIVIVMWLAATVANTARLRFQSPEDVDGSVAGHGSQRVRNAASVTQNTTEQSVLAVASHGALAATFDAARGTIVACVILFSIGRLLFWMGYGGGATRRALGFALTYYPSVAALFLSGLAAMTLIQ